MEYKSLLTKQPHSDKTRKLPVKWHIFLFIISFIILFSRRPDALLNAQFWAEDGELYYADMYNFGVIHSLFSPYPAGYLQTLPRLTAAFAQLFPLVFGPIIFNLIAIIVQILPVNLIASSRLSRIVPSFTTRLFLAFLYLAIPNSSEIHANATNSQWYLALLAYLVVVAMPSPERIWRFFDMGVILLAATSGPFSLLLAPIAALYWLLRLQKWSFFLLLGLATGALIQGICIFYTAHSARLKAPLGATLEQFVNIIAGQVFLGALIGQEGYSWILNNLSNSYSFIALLVTFAGITLLLYSILKAPLALRLFIIFAALILGSALVSPAASATMPQWQVMVSPGACQRYYFMPLLAFMATIVWMLGQKHPRYLKIAATLALAIMVFGIALDWQHPAFTNFQFREYSAQFVGAPKGTQIEIPINPPGWHMELTKH